MGEKQGVYTYIQVTADVTAEETFEREMRPLNITMEEADSASSTYVFSLNPAPVANSSLGRSFSLRPQFSPPV